MTRRESVRDHRGTTMGLEQLSRLLALAGGLRDGGRRRTTPSSGALYPIELYPVVHDVEGLEPGVYHYAVADHGLHRLRNGDLRAETVHHGLMQEFLGTANAVDALLGIDGTEELSVYMLSVGTI